MSWDWFLTWLSGAFMGFGLGWLVGRQLAFRWMRAEIDGLRMALHRALREKGE